MRFSPGLVDIPPVFVFVQSLRQALLILVLLVQKMATECFFGSHSNFLCRLGHVMTVVGSCNEWWIRPNNYLSKLTSVFHECGKGSVSWWLNTTNVNIMINISIGIKRWSSHETSHTSMSEIYEFRVHSSILPTRAESWVRASQNNNWFQNFFLLHSAILFMSSHVYIQ